MDNKSKKSAKIYITLTVVLLLISTYITIKYWPYIMGIIKDPQSFRKFLLSYGNFSILIFIALEILQILIPILPGEVIQAAGGYMYGVFFGSIYLIIGALIGSTLAFFISKFVGYPIVKIFVSKENLEKFNFLMQNKKTEFTIFILFLIPGIPKDVLIYIGGITPITSLRFLTISTLGRLPGLIGSAYIGTNLQEKKYLAAVIILGISILLFGIGLLVKEKVVARLGAKFKS